MPIKSHDDAMIARFSKTPASAIALLKDIAADTNTTALTCDMPIALRQVEKAFSSSISDGAEETTRLSNLVSLYRSGKATMEEVRDLVRAW